MLFEIPSSSSLSGAALAYLGDSVLELIARQYLLSTGVTDVGKLNSLALSYVKATAQSDAMENLLPVLTAEEAAVFRRGRNSHSIAIPKSAKAGQYRRATGMEALFAWLYINGRTDRMKELFTVGFIGENGGGVAPNPTSFLRRKRGKKGWKRILLADKKISGQVFSTCPVIFSE